MKRAVRRVLDALAIATVVLAVLLIESMPAWLPFLLIAAAFALAYLNRRVTIADRRRERLELIRSTRGIR